MKLNRVVLFMIFILGCNQHADNVDYNRLSTKQLLDTNKFHFREYSKLHNIKNYKIALETANILIKRDTTNFDIYLNKFNLLSSAEYYRYAILFNDSIYSKFKTDTSIAITLLLAKGHLQEKMHNEEANLTYQKADMLARHSLGSKIENISTTRYVTYVSTGALAYNADTVIYRIAEYKKYYPKDTATINILSKLK